jgi:hypothetical protein
VLDDTVVITGVNIGPKAFRSGDFFWSDSKSSGELFENAGSNDVRLVNFVFANEKSAK